MKSIQLIALSSLLAIGLLGCEQGAAPGRSNPSAPGDSSKNMQQNGNPSTSSALPQSSSVPAAQSSSPAQTLDDDLVLNKVKTALADVPGLHSSQIDVSVSRGVVTLSGTVSDANQRTQVVQFVSHVEGVQSVVDHLEVA